MGSNTRVVKIGDVLIGGGNPVAVQSMTNTDTEDVAATTAQILELERAGCEIVRSAVYSEKCAKCIPDIKSRIHIPFVADVHFDARLAVAAIENGADKVRINPGNIGRTADVVRVVDAAKMHGTPIRVGANSGSLSKDILRKFGGPTADVLIESTLENIRILENNGLTNIVVAVKSTDVRVCVEAYRKISRILDYPLHIGITEAGILRTAAVKSAVGLGALLVDGIGDTIRVSVTGDPIQEISIAKLILSSVEQRPEENA